MICTEPGCTKEFVAGSADGRARWCQDHLPRGPRRTGNMAGQLAVIGGVFLASSGLAGAWLALAWETFQAVTRWVH